MAEQAQVRRRTHLPEAEEAAAEVTASRRPGALRMRDGDGEPATAAAAAAATARGDRPMWTHDPHAARRRTHRTLRDPGTRMPPSSTTSR
nr:TPA_asm: m106.5 ORF [Murid betaherpesvirus 1]DBA08062.1 TPA_asm: m106.5 ORF [Murid betaherpesvirus 1]